jgi:glutamate-ammonia-ligase adenylyltransferase
LRLLKLSEDFVKKIAEISAGNLPSAVMEDLLNLIESEIENHFFTHSSESNLLRIIQGMFDRISFLNECVRYPHYVEILVNISVNSNYLTDILVINPEYFYWVVNPSILESRLENRAFLKEVKDTMERYRSFNAKVHALKSIKRKELLRIGLKDIYSKTNLIEITEELSILASTLISELFDLCYKETLAKNNIIKTGRRYCIVSLGKLGGNELNYSSDTDLVIFYDKESKLNNKKFYSEILTETIHLFLQSAAPAEAGLLYRIDLRLRPDGRNSPLCRSVNEYLNYYESRGEDWERQMLIKTEFLGGSKKLFEKFISYLAPFIYPHTHISSPIEQIKKLKLEIERKLRDEENIKLTPGGIRDIEFSVQALQLLNGGKNKEIRMGNTLNALNELKKASLLTKKEKETFETAYILYRKIEHFLQLMNNAQTHVVPQDGETAEKLIYFLGFESPAKFKKILNEKRISVRKIYDSILSKKDNKKFADHNLDELNFADPGRAAKNFLYLQEGKGLIGVRRFDKKSAESFKTIEQEIIRYLKTSSFPDKLLDNFVRIIRQAEFPSIWYNEFKESKFLNIFLIICEYSQRSVDLFAEDKELRDFFLSRGFLKKINLKYAADYSVKKILFTLSTQCTLGLISRLKTSDLLSKIIREKIKGLSGSFVENYKWKNTFFIAALGSAGSGEMTFSSDVDLVFVVKDIVSYPKIENNFQDLLALLRDELKPIPVDCRLRPEGKNSQLVWDNNEYKKYFNARARTWEFQSLIKTNFITGNKKLLNSFNRAMTTAVKKKDSSEIKKEIIEMRKKISPPSSSHLNIIDIKKSRGGIADIEFALHYYILCNPSLLSKCRGKSIPSIIDKVEDLKLAGKIKQTIKKNFIFLKELEIINQIVFNKNTSKLAKDILKPGILTKLFNKKVPVDIKRELSRVIKSNIKLYSDIFHED